MLASAVLALAVALGLPAPAAAQDLHPSRRPSPMGMARINLGDAYVSVTYSRPYKRGRDNIFGTKESGALVPFGQVWRTGANEATQITLTRDFEVAGKKLAAGTYSLFTTPGPEEWTIHFNSALGLWGTDRRLEAGGFEPGYAAANDVRHGDRQAERPGRRGGPVHHLVREDRGRRRPGDALDQDRGAGAVHRREVGGPEQGAAAKPEEGQPVRRGGSAPGTAQRRIAATVPLPDHAHPARRLP